MHVTLQKLIESKSKSDWINLLYPNPILNQFSPHSIPPIHQSKTIALTLQIPDLVTL